MRIRAGTATRIHESALPVMLWLLYWHSEGTELMQSMARICLGHRYGRKCMGHGYLDLCTRHAVAIPGKVYFDCNNRASMPNHRAPERHVMLCYVLNHSARVDSTHVFHYSYSHNLSCVTSTPSVVFVRMKSPAMVQIFP
jgi:hypothetical protein